MTRLIVILAAAALAACQTARIEKLCDPKGRCTDVYIGAEGSEMVKVHDRISKLKPSQPTPGVVTVSDPDEVTEESDAGEDAPKAQTRKIRDRDNRNNGTLSTQDGGATWTIRDKDGIRRGTIGK